MGRELRVVHDVVPDEQMGGEGAPGADVFHELPVLGAVLVVKGMCKTAFDAAKAYDYVVPGGYAYRRLAGVLIGKSPYELVRELFFDGVCPSLPVPNS